MKPAVACLLVALASAYCLPTVAQSSGDPVERPRECSSLADAEKPKCVAKFSRADMAALDNWIFSETTSPIDYSPVVVASATAIGAADGLGMRLAIACRGGNTFLALTAPGVLPAGEDYAVAYAVDGSSPTTLGAAGGLSATGMALGVDAVRLLASLPAQGEIAFRIVRRRGEMVEGRYSLAGLKATLARMADPCKWPTKSSTTRK